MKWVIKWSMERNHSRAQKCRTPKYLLQEHNVFIWGRPSVWRGGSFTLWRAFPNLFCRMCAFHWNTKATASVWFHSVNHGKQMKTRMPTEQQSKGTSCQPHMSSSPSLFLFLPPELYSSLLIHSLPSDFLSLFDVANGGGLGWDYFTVWLGTCCCFRNLKVAPPKSRTFGSSDVSDFSSQNPQGA